MKNILTFFFCILQLIGWAQNPITQAVTYQYTNDKTWRKVSTIDYDFQGTDLIKETQRVYNNVLDDWYTSSEEWFDTNNNTTRKITRNFISQNSGFFIRDNQFSYSESGQLLLTLRYVQERNNKPLTLISRTEYEYLADCSYLQRVYEKGNSTTAGLFLSWLQLALYDDECRFARFISSTQVDATIDELKSTIRITYKPLRNGRQRRILEVQDCPTGVQNCNQWDIKEQIVFDAAGRDIVREIGSVNDFVRTLTTIQYDANQTIYNYRTFIKLNGINQVLTGIEEEILDLQERQLDRKRAELFVFEDWNYDYSEAGYIQQATYERSSKSAAGISVFTDTTTYSYQFYCDGLPSEMITKEERGQSRTTYSYLFPADCKPLATTKKPVVFKLFPNPASDFVTIVSEQLVNQPTSISIIDGYGRIVQSQQNQQNPSQTIDIQAIPNGRYFLQVTNPKTVTTQPFIIAR